MKTLIAYPAFKNRASNPYQALLYAELQGRGWTVWDLDSGTRRLVRPGIVHIHWPDGFAFHRGLLKTLFRAGLLLILLDWYRLRGSKVVWTLHNLRSHENFHPRVEGWFWRQFYQRLDGWIALNAFSTEIALEMPVLRDLPYATIPIGVFPRLGVSSGILDEGNSGHGGILFFGKIRTYKEIPLLVEAFSGLGIPNLSLTIAGQSHDAQLTEFLATNELVIPNLHVHCRFIPDEELDKLISTATVVIIPYAESLNSGVVFQALSYDKPVIAPSTPSFLEICNDFGPGLIRLFKPPLTSEKLAACLANPADREIPTTRARERYNWSNIAEAHDKFFQQLVVKA